MPPDRLAVRSQRTNQRTRNLRRSDTPPHESQVSTAAELAGLRAETLLLQHVDEGYLAVRCVGNS